MNKQQTIYIVDDEEPVRRALTLLAKADGLQSKSYSSALAFLDEIDKVGPGCLLLDVCMPEMTGPELQEELKNRGCLLPVIIITGHGDVPVAVRAMQDGAQDFIEKPFDSEDLMDRVHKCLSNAAKKDELEQQKLESGKLLAQLTPREYQIMELLVAGRRNKEIARELFISFRTVELHRAKIMEKLNAKSLSDVVRLAMLHTMA
ncbi:response regulator transcription factor [Candidatus Thiodiazotropha sp. CDECU1]|uniref:response regulator transcription factor n=1 Tax=Candidatus Thiodiazotropha sp. CDECU1 TaxID=3065865 RepID=UPI00292E4238|nr:response regulator [Candidatus Thiodiazotropha sp. CDECU1]